MKIKILTLVSILLYQLTALGQSGEIDSLKKVAANSTKDSNLVNTYLELAKLYTRIDSDTALFYCNQTIKTGKEVNNYKGIANAYRQIGIVYYMKAEYDKAIDNFTKSLQTWQDAGDEKGVGRAYMNIGIIYFNLGQYDKALENYMKSSDIQARINDIDGLARSHNNIANIYTYQNNTGLALEYSFKSLKSHEELGNEEEVATTLYNIGNIYEAQLDLKRAIDYYEKALTISEKLGDKKQMADIYDNIGSVYQKMGDGVLDTITESQQNDLYSKAISCYEKSLPLYSEIGFEKGISKSFSRIGKINLSRKQFNSVLANFEKSRDSYEAMGDKFELGDTYLYIGKYYNAIKKYRPALENLKRAKSLADELNSLELSMEVTDEMSKSYAALGEYKDAYEMHYLSREIEKKFRNVASKQDITNQEINYQVNKKQREMELEQQKKDLMAQEEIRRQSMITTFAFIALGLVALMAFFIFRGYRIKQKSNVLLAAQRDEILQKNEELLQLNEEITAQRELTEHQRDIAIQRQKEITDSIVYAKRIQAAVMPQRQMFVELVPDYFIYFKPRDIVSGDFYWMKKLSNHIVVAAADCTGHGVPGAFMSLLGIAFLNEVVNDELVDAGEILDKLRERIIEALHQTWKDDEAKDGMDISLNVINMETKELNYAGAYNPLYLIRNGELLETKADKMPIGIHIKEHTGFTSHKIQLQENDTVYLFSDGYIDQFGGEKSTKFKSGPFKELLLSLQDKPMHEQKKEIDSNYKSWKGEEKQLDDILIIGMRF